MVPKYNLSSKSDMQRFKRDLKKNVLKAAESSLQKKGYTIECPHCKRPTFVHTGSNTCRFCNGIINVALDIK